MKKEFIDIRGAREHNLKNLNVKIPRNKFITVTGVSGSGKSSLAFDTVYAEGQRRYVESLSSYARQFLGQLKKPKVDSISGIPPAVAIQQKGPGYNPRSTVGTLTEIYDYMRLLFARIGKPFCPNCGVEISSRSITEIVEQIMDEGEGKNISIYSPVVRGRKGEYRDLLLRLRAEGYLRVVIDENVHSLEEAIKLDPNKKHTIKVVVDRIKLSGSQSNNERLADSIELASKISDGIIEVDGIDEELKVFSIHYACPSCGISIGEYEPRNFSFNSPFGACPECSGLGIKLIVDPELVVRDKTLSINQGAISAWWDPITNRKQRWKSSAKRYRYQMLETLAKALSFSLDTPFYKLPKKIRDIILNSSKDEYEFDIKMGKNNYHKKGRFEGIVTELSRRYLQTDSQYIREKIQTEYMREMDCPVCGGYRLKKESLAVYVNGRNIADMVDMPIKELRNFFKGLELSTNEALIASKVLEEIIERLSFLIDVGIDYVSLNRKANTLSSGESERIRLATQIGSSLVGVVYILDEPTVGLHARDTHRLLNSLVKLRDLGNTLLVVEHDQQTLDVSDYIIDLGPAAGVNGGRIVFKGSVEQFKRSGRSITSKYYTGKLKVSAPQEPRKHVKGKLKLKKCSQFNLKNIDVEFPLGVFNCVTGVSGSGKSTLVEEILYKGLRKIKDPIISDEPGQHKSILGADKINRIINIDQTPIGRTPRSNPATYTGVFTPIRELFADMPLSKARGYGKGRFSFNVKEGTCLKCQGQGEIKLEMHFLPDIFVPCEACKGKKFTESTLDVKFKGHSIYEVLELTVDESMELFAKIPAISRILDTLIKVGLGYIKLGQSSITLSGGEAQRIKLAKELAKTGKGDTLYILDEPTTGLHPHDIKYLLKVLHSLVDNGNSVIVIEHNMDVIANSDWIIDLGPDGGDRGGEVVICGTQKDLIKYSGSYTGKYLKKHINANK